VIEPYYYDYWGNRVETPESTRRALLAAMGYDADARETEDERRALPPVIVAQMGETPALPPGIERWSLELEGGKLFRGELCAAPLGYHRLTARCANHDQGCSFIVVPSRCFVSPKMRNARIWALATQLYALCSDRNWGIGDFTDLSELASIAGRAGARAIALNPLHELFPHQPTSCSPYSPSSRLFLNVLYIDVERVPELDLAAELRSQIEHGAFGYGLENIRFEKFVDYVSVSGVKHTILEELYEVFVGYHLVRNDARARAFKKFARDGGALLERLATYEALAQHFWSRDPACYGWQQWPAEFRSPTSAEVGRFVQGHRKQIDFFLYLQWIAEGQLKEAAANARRADVSLYMDLAVGASLNGADVWADRDAYVVEASLGAPADPLNAQGQNWGLAPFSPRALRERAYEPFIALLRANMRHAGILRVDHVMALARAYWIPRGAPASQGAYVCYRLDEMLGILALESVRNRCAVVGEDLGTVPDGFRERMESAHALSSRVLYFQRDWNDGSFLPPDRYPRVAAASIGTHDLPTLAGWWTGDRSAHEDRARDRFLLVDALERAGCIDAPGASRLRDDAVRGGTLAVVPELSAAAHRFVGGTPSMLVVVAIEDVLNETGSINVPGTFEEHPNWQRKRSMLLESIEADGRLLQISRMLSR
jgi:4-alpha-glucanotransferase